MERRIEPDLKYCPRCGDEYRAEIEQCATCQVELLSGRQLQALEQARQAERGPRSMAISPDDELVDIRKGPVLTIKEMQLVLARHQIPALALGEDSGCSKGCCGTDLLLRVRLNDAREAIQILEEEHRRSTGLHEYDTSHVDAVFDPGAAETTCPACGCTFAPSIPSCPDCGLCFF